MDGWFCKLFAIVRYSIYRVVVGSGVKRRGVHDINLYTDDRRPTSHLGKFRTAIFLQRVMRFTSIRRRMNTAREGKGRGRISTLVHADMLCDIGRWINVWFYGRVFGSADRTYIRLDQIQDRGRQPSCVIMHGHIS